MTAVNSSINGHASYSAQSLHLAVRRKLDGRGIDC